MKGKVALLIWLAVLGLFVAGSGAVAYKIHQRKKAAAAQAWEAKLVFPVTEGATPEQVEEAAKELDGKLDRYEVLRPVIDELDLVAFWGLADVNEAMERLKACTGARVEGGQVVFATQDKDKEMAGRIQKQVAESYDRVERLNRYGLPALPPP